MPRFYNPEDSDFTLWFTQLIQNGFQDKFLSISEDEIKQSISYFKQQYMLKNQSNPSIVLKKDCSRGHFFFDPSNRINQFFPVSYVKQNHKIVICQNLINNHVQLLSNLKRELFLADLYSSYDLNQDANFACASLKSCKQGYDTYEDSQRTQKASHLCSKLIFRYRGPNQDDIPYDAWVRLTDKLIKQKSHCYNDQFSLN